MPLAAAVACCALLVGRAAGQGFHARGDADCSAGLTAADLVATARAIDGAGDCDNGDCDRDGVLTPADVVCAAGCLFGACPVPPQAARVTAVAADSAPTLVPVSLVRLVVDNLDPAAPVARVTVGGLEAEVVEREAGALLVALPVGLPPGAAEVVVFAGEIAGPPFVVDIAPAVPLGAPDSFDGVLGLLDALLAGMLALDADAGLGDAAPLVRAELTRFRGELAAQRAAFAADATIGERERLQLDAAIDAAGLAEEMRAALAEIELAADAGADAPAVLATATQPVLAFQRGARTVKIAATAAKAAAATLSTPAIVAIATGAGIIAGISLAAEDPLTPLIFEIEFVSAEDGQRQVWPRAGSIARVRGARFDALTTSLAIDTAFGRFLGSNAAVSGETISFGLPDAVGFCGAVTFTLVRPGGFVSNAVASRIQPEVLMLASGGRGGQELAVAVRGTNPCDAAFDFFVDVGLARARAPLTHTGAHSATFRVPVLPPGTYYPRLQVQRLNELGNEFLISNGLTGLALDCPAEIALPDTQGGVGDVAVCFVRLLPALIEQPPRTQFHWRSTRPGRVQVSEITGVKNNSLKALASGEAGISVTLQDTDPAATVPLLASSEVVPVRVVDRVRPRVTVSTTIDRVAPGSTLVVLLEASDNDKLGPVTLRTTGDAVEGAAEQVSLACTDQKTCSTTFNVKLREDGFTSSVVTIQAEAVDQSLNLATSNTLSFNLDDTSCPTLTFQQPANGGTVNAGETIEVVAVARDDQPGDSGVARFRYRATGAALLAEVGVNLPLPLPQATSTLRFGFTVKEAADLADVTDRTIVVGVEAFDAARPPNTCGEQAISLGVLGTLDRCEGSITVDRSSGYIGDPFTITVALTGDGADDITRVTSVNPGGQFDLQAGGGGVYTVTLFYQGTGAFSLRFLAFDAAGEERCSGSIGLEALGPKPEAGVAAARHGDQPAGASLRPSP